MSLRRLDQRKNLLNWSEDFSNAVWRKHNTNIMANAISAPDGSNNASAITRTSTTVNCTISRAVLFFIGKSIALSIYAKAKSVSGRLGMRIQGNYPDMASAVFDLNAGTVSNYHDHNYLNAVAAITPVNDGWYRCSLTVTIAISTCTDVYIGTTDNTKTSYDWEAPISVLSDCYVWGAQLELGSAATAYQHTTDGPVNINLSPNSPLRQL